MERFVKKNTLKKIGTLIGGSLIAFILFSNITNDGSVSKDQTPSFPVPNPKYGCLAGLVELDAFGSPQNPSDWSKQNPNYMVLELSNGDKYCRPITNENEILVNYTIANRITKKS